MKDIKEATRRRKMAVSPPELEVKRLPLHVYFKENFKRFLKETSLNGLKYITDVQRSLWERCYYLISFSIVFTFGMYMAFYFFQKWQRTPVIIGISPKATSILDMPFPSVSFCNMNQALASKVRDIQPDTPEYGMLQKICFQHYNYSRFVNFKPRFAGDSFVNFKLQNCSSMMVYCKYGPYEEKCSNLFREIILDEGLCCIFNHLHPFFLYKSRPNFLQDYTPTSARTNIPINWNLETGYKEPLPKSYYPRKAAGAGVSMGLTVVLYADIDEYHCSSTNGDGFKTLLYNPLDTPYVRESGLPIMLGHQTRIRINARLMESQASLRQIDPKDRQCYFSNEKELVCFKYYTRRSCEAECEAMQIFRHCNCIPYHMPRVVANATTCFLGENDCVLKTERLTPGTRVLKCKTECLPACHDLQYFPDMFFTPMASKEFNLQAPLFRSISKKMLQKNLALVQIFYKDNYFRGSTKVPYMGFIELLSQTGGILSLMVGFSVISIVEVFVFILLKPFCDILMRRNPTILESKDEQIGKAKFERDKFHPQMLFKRRKNINNRVMNWDKMYRHATEKF